MGASVWDYTVPYREDFAAALAELQEKVFADGDYYWARGQIFTPASDHGDRPATVDELWEDELVQQEGTHSILDMQRVLPEGAASEFGGVRPVTAAEALSCAGTERLTTAHMPLFDDLTGPRWTGRCAVLHDAAGRPESIHFWGYSGD
ncbi:hypothetical protein GCM10022251_69060 [Phytohabitans flavus]|uniref:Uncharacterized protein n=1 Tax=Phytohabitans flavus TaxID=1076124 RepID=A0A6F8XUU3_9ACTN|nr:hypothetical protein [Phytohabitans flavus]BCB77557.1 hypothetical protein Pflav_039670 [Phytohabitans flavus]